MVLHAVLLHLHQLVLLLFHAVENRRLLLLPYKDIVNHGAAAEQNPNADQNARYNRRR